MSLSDDELLECYAQNAVERVVFPAPVPATPVEPRSYTVLTALPVLRKINCGVCGSLVARDHTCSVCLWRDGL